MTSANKPISEEKGQLLTSSREKKPHWAAIWASSWKMSILPREGCMIGMKFIPGRRNIFRVPLSLSI